MAATTFDSAADAWPDIQRLVEQHPGLGWLRALRIVAAEPTESGASVTLGPHDGQGDIARFAAAPRQVELLKKEFSQRLAGPVSVRVLKPGEALEPRSTASPQHHPDAPHPAGAPPASHGSTNPASRPGSATTPAPTGNALDSARNLPLVKEALKAFPDASFANVRKLDESNDRDASRDD